MMTAAGHDDSVESGARATTAGPTQRHHSTSGRTRASRAPPATSEPPRSTAVGSNVASTAHAPTTAMHHAAAGKMSTDLAGLRPTARADHRGRRGRPSRVPPPTTAPVSGARSGASGVMRSSVRDRGGALRGDRQQPPEPWRRGEHEAAGTDDDGHAGTLEPASGARERPRSGGQEGRAHDDTPALWPGLLDRQQDQRRDTGHRDSRRDPPGALRRGHRRRSLRPPPAGGRGHGRRRPGHAATDARPPRRPRTRRRTTRRTPHRRRRSRHPRARNRDGAPGPRPPPPPSPAPRARTRCPRRSRRTARRPGFPRRTRPRRRRRSTVPAAPCRGVGVPSAPPAARR